jgi:hypothetical protein
MFDWAATSAYTSKNNLLSSEDRVHTLVVLVIINKSSEDLFRAEVLTIATVMATSLEGEKFLSSIVILVSKQDMCVFKMLITIDMS